jgi:hypothetical protein
VGLHLYSRARTPSDAAVRRVARDRLMQIADRARAVVNGPVEVF